MSAFSHFAANKAIPRACGTPDAHPENIDRWVQF
jgi:hypothetical protein